MIHKHTFPKYQGYYPGTAKCFYCGITYEKYIERRRINYFSHNWLMKLRHDREFKKQSHHIKGKVIDLGCGNAPYKREMLKIADNYTGIDWTASCNVDIVADITKKLVLEDNSADTILCFQVLEHIPNPIFLLGECYRVLKSGGVLFLTIPFQFRIHEAPHDYYRFTRYAIEYMLVKAGFREFAIDEMGGFWYTVLLKINYFIATKTRIFKYLFVPIFFINQVLALGLDKLVTSSQETIGYTVIVKK